jgi:pyruvate kinase
MSFELIVTLGPAMQDAERLRRVAAKADCLFRINGAHAAQMDQVRRTIAFVRGALPDAKLLIDLPGNKIRVAHVEEPIRLTEGKTFNLFHHQFNYKEFHRFLRPGQTVLANDSLFRFEVKRIESAYVEFLSHSDGELVNNKGFHLQGETLGLPFLFDKDKELIAVGVGEGIHALGLSFIRTAADVDDARAAVNSKAMRLIGKVETLAAVANIDAILGKLESILVDRGDLSAESGMLELPRLQALILEAARERGVKVFLATQFLRNMTENSVPLIAEAIDLHNTLRGGVSGLQLSEETAIGRYPEECVDFVMEMRKIAAAATA